MYLISLKRPCGSLKVRVQQIWLGEVLGAFYPNLTFAGK
jgi:hypothetical protein